MPGPVWDRLSEADANEDGSVTQREVIQLATSRLFGRFDENEDDKLSEPEVPGLMWKRLSKADSDEDGLISFGELVDNILSAPRGGRPVDRDKPKNRGIRGGK